MTEKYLVMVSGENNNKYYHMIPNQSGCSFTVEYGRIGVTKTVKTYNSSQFEGKLTEKLRKGYVDQTALRATGQTTRVPTVKYKDIPDKGINDLLTFLMQRARQNIARNYKVEAEAVTQAMVDVAQDELDSLVGLAQVGADPSRFNERLLSLFSVIPRRMANVRDFLAIAAGEYDSIINREQRALDVMRGQVNAYAQPDVPLTEKAETLLDVLGIKISPATKEDLVLIRSNLGGEEGLLYRAWRVTNLASEKRYKDFLREHKGIKRKMFWHGSRTENWFNILKTGLKIRPSNAATNGSMFGHGIYFAPKATKSIGYTSLRGSRWAIGTESNAFLALHEVAYGKPFHINVYEPWHSNLTYEKLRQASAKADCVHVHGAKQGQRKPGMLYNDEIIIYREDQTSIKYLVELKA